jgi:hypothetical protein
MNKYRHIYRHCSCVQEIGYVALDGNFLRLTATELQCAVLPDGEFVVAENNTGRLTRHLEKLVAKRQG